MPAKKKGPGLKEFIWNSEEKTFLGRNGTSWLKITVFYIIFYTCLLAFWAACLAVFLQTISYKEPRRTTNDGSIIGGSPGLGFRPNPPKENVESTLIMFNEGPGENWGHWVSSLTNLTKLYDAVTDEERKRMKSCDYDTKLKKDEFCEFKVSALGNRCTAENKFGYEAGQPCIVVKLNNIFKWLPETYHSIDDMPANMPKAAVEIIERDFTNADGNITQQNVWITCEGENPNDFESIGEIKYYPHPGMPTYYYPFTNVEGYRSPLVAVEFASIRKGVLVNVECKAWAKNIHHDRKERRGLVHLELMVD